MDWNKFRSHHKGSGLTSTEVSELYQSYKSKNTLQNGNELAIQPKDILRKIALDMDYKDIINLCKSNKKINDKLCKDEHFWRMKYEKDIGSFSFQKIYLKNIENVDVDLKDINPKILNFMNSEYNFSNLKRSAQRDIYDTLFSSVNIDIKNDRIITISFWDVKGIMDSLDAMTGGFGDVDIEDYISDIFEIFDSYIQDYDKKHGTNLVYEYHGFPD